MAHSTRHIEPLLPAEAEGTGGDLGSLSASVSSAATLAVTAKPTVVLATAAASSSATFSVYVPAPARQFDGVDDELRCAVDTANLTGALSMFAVVRAPTDLSAGMTIVSNHTSGGAARATLGVNTSGQVFLNIGAAQNSTTTVSRADGWVIVGVTKASGTVTARAHIYKGGSWTHENLTGTNANAATQAGGTHRFFTFAGIVWYPGEIALSAQWTSELSDANVETLDDGAATQSWANLSPQALWEFNQTSVATALVDLIGNADQTLITGTTAIDTGPSWTYGASTAAVVSLASAAATSSATLALTAPAKVLLDTAAAVSSATCVVYIPSVAADVPLQTSAATSASTLALTAPAKLVLQTTASVSSATLNLAQYVPLASSTATSTATLVATALTKVPLDTAAVQSSATLTVTTPTTINVRVFDGSGDYVEVGQGTISGNFNNGGGWTLLVLAKPTIGNTLALMALGNNGGGTVAGIYLDSTGEVRIGTDNPNFDGHSTLTATNNAWQLFAVTQSAGGGTPRLHRCTLGGSWSHANNTTGTMGTNVAGTPMINYFGRFRNGGGDFLGRMAMAAYWPRGLSDANLETIGSSSQSVYAITGGSPAELWEFDQTPITTPVGTADQVSISGTTVTAEAVTWTYGVGAATIPLQSGASVSSATLALTAKPTIPLATAASVSAATLNLAQYVPLQSSPATSAATLALTAPAKLTLATSPAVSAATLALTAAAKTVLATSPISSSATLTLTAPAIAALAGASVSTATLALTAPAKVVLTAAATSTATLVVTTPAATAVDSPVLDLTWDLYAVVGAYAPVVLADSPAYYWRFEDAGPTTANDATANNVDGTLVMYGPPYTQAWGEPGIQGSSSLYLPEPADYEGFGNGVEQTGFNFYGHNTITTEGWWNGKLGRQYWLPEDGTSAPHIFWESHEHEDPLTNRGVFAITLNGAISLFMAELNSSIWTNAWPGDGRWVHVVLTFNQTTHVAELFINGVSKGTRTNNGVWQPNDFISLAGDIDGWGGWVDEFAVYDTILTPTQITAHYNAGSAAVLDFKWDTAGDGIVMSAAAVSNATLSVQAGPGQIPTAPSTAVSNATLALTAQPRVVPQSSAVVSTASLALTAATRLTLAASVAASTANLTLTAQNRVVLAATGSASGATLTLKTAVQLTLTSDALSSATLAISVKTTLTLATSTAVLTATMELVQPFIPETTHPDLGGGFDQSLTYGMVVSKVRGGVFDQTLTGGRVTATVRSASVGTFRSAALPKPRSGLVSAPLLGGIVRELRVGGIVREPRLGANVGGIRSAAIDETITGGDVLDVSDTGASMELVLSGAPNDSTRSGEVY